DPERQAVRDDGPAGVNRSRRIQELRGKRWVDGPACVVPLARGVVAALLLCEGEAKRRPIALDGGDKDRLWRRIHKERDSARRREDDMREPDGLILVLLDVLREMQRPLNRARIPNRPPVDVLVHGQHDARVTLKGERLIAA